MKRLVTFEGQEVLKQDVDYLQQTKEDAIKERFVDLFTYGIVDGLCAHDDGLCAGYIEVTAGTAYDSIGERIEVPGDVHGISPDGQCIPTGDYYVVARYEEGFLPASRLDIDGECHYIYSVDDYALDMFPTSEGLCSVTDVLLAQAQVDTAWVGICYDYSGQDRVLQKTELGQAVDASFVTRYTEPGVPNSIRHYNLTGGDLHEPKPHHASHEAGGVDVLNVDGLCGVLLEKQPPQSYGQVVTVAKANGDCSDILSAYNNITDNAESKRYAILVYPGAYTPASTITLNKDYVDIIGVDRDSCVIERNSAQALFTVATSYSLIKNLTLKNTDGAVVSVGSMVWAYVENVLMESPKYGFYITNGGVDADLVVMTDAFQGIHTEGSAVSSSFTNCDIVGASPLVLLAGSLFMRSSSMLNASYQIRYEGTGTINLDGCRIDIAYGADASLYHIINDSNTVVHFTGCEIISEKSYSVIGSGKAAFHGCYLDKPPNVATLEHRGYGLVLEQGTSFPTAIIGRKFYRTDLQTEYVCTDVDIPFWAVNTPVPYGQTVLVAKSGAPYYNIQTAIDSIADATESKPYTVLIYPGEYVRGWNVGPVVCKPWVDLVGVSPDKVVIKSYGGPYTVDCASNSNVVGLQVKTETAYGPNPGYPSSDGTYFYIPYFGSNFIAKYLASDLSYVDQLGWYGVGNDQFQTPVGVHHDNTYLYVADTNNDRIVKRLKSDLSYVSKIGSWGSGNDQFNNPMDITCDGASIFVSDTYNHRIVARQASDLSYVAEVGSEGSGDEQFNSPRGITHDGVSLFIADAYNNRIIVRNQADLSYVGKVGTMGSGDDNFWGLEGIDCDDTYLYIADTLNRRIVKRLKSDLSFVAKVYHWITEKEAFGVVVDDTYLYTGVTGKPGYILKFLKSNLSFVSQVTVGTGGAFRAQNCTNVKLQNVKTKVGLFGGLFKTSVVKVVDSEFPYASGEWEASRSFLADGSCIDVQNCHISTYGPEIRGDVSSVVLRNSHCDGQCGILLKDNGHLEVLNSSFDVNYSAIKQEGASTLVLKDSSFRDLTKPALCLDRGTVEATNCSFESADGTKPVIDQGSANVELLNCSVDGTCWSLYSSVNGACVYLGNCYLNPKPHPDITVFGSYLNGVDYEFHSSGGFSP